MDERIKAGAEVEAHWCRRRLFSVDPVAAGNQKVVDFKKTLEEASMSDLKNHPDEYWKQKLTPQQYRVARQRGTEAPFSGALLQNKETGMYKCVACAAELFNSETKFDSGTGWPSFTDPVNREQVELHEDASLGMRRTEVTCKNCGAHLGHVFPDGPGASGQRYCINSLALEFDPKATT